MRQVIRRFLKHLEAEKNASLTTIESYRYDLHKFDNYLVSGRVCASLAMWRDKTLSLSIDLRRDIGVGWHGRTLLIGNPRWCQFSILVVERDPVASVFYPRRQREPSIPLHEWECLEHLDGLRCELCLLLPARISGRVTPADETVFREPYRKAELMVYGLEKILEAVDSDVDVELLSVPMNAQEIDAIAACVGAIHELFEPAPRQGRIRGRGRATETHAGCHQMGPEVQRLLHCHVRLVGAVGFIESEQDGTALFR